MSAAAKHIETLQHYKDYADSTAALNESLNREIKDCYGQIDSLRLEIKRMEHESSARNSIAQLQNADSLKASQAELQLHGISDELHRAKIHIMSLEAQLESEQSTSSSRLRMIQQKEDEVDQLRRNCRELETRLWEVEHKSETVVLQLQRQTALSASYQEMLEKRITQISEMQRQAELQIEGDVASNVQQYAQQNEMLRQDNQQLREAIAQLEQALHKSQHDYEWLKKVMNEKGGNQENLLKQVSNTTEERKQIYQQLKRSQEQLLQCMRDNDQLRLQLTQLNAELREKDNRLRDESSKSFGMEEELRQLKRTRSLLEDQIVQLKQAKNHQIESLNSKIEHMNSLLVEQRRSFEHKGSMERSGSEQPSNLLSIVSETSFHSQCDIDRLKEQNSKLTRQLQLKNQILREFEERVDEQTRRLDELNASKMKGVASAEVLEQLARTRARLELSQSTVRQANDLRMEKSKLQTMVELLQLENAELKKKVAALEAQAQLKASQVDHKQQFGSYSVSGPTRNELMQMQKEYSETLLQNTLLLEENSQLETKRLELTRDLEDIRLELSHHANSFDQMKDLKGRLRDAYGQLDHLNRLLAERDVELHRRQYGNMRSPQRQGRVPMRNPQQEWPNRSKSPVQRLISPNERAQELNNNHNGYWVEIQNKIKALKAENEQLRKNLSSGIPARK